MKKLLVLLVVLSAAAFALPALAAEMAPIDPCVNCHETITPGIIKQWQDSKHSKVGVKCYVCHEAKKGDPSGYNHNGFNVTAIPSPKYCEGCHSQEVAEYQNSKHAWTAFFGPLKPYYKKAREMGLDPMAQDTAKELNPVKMAKLAVTPLYPDSGILKKIGLLDNPDYNHNNVVLGCIECHGSFVVAEGDGELKGWPNVGTGRINPDGSLGSCTSCHTRHLFSMAEARRPETCGQCHLGPDHPQAEIYEESKHGNIHFAIDAESGNFDVPGGQWGPEDIIAPTCATCHMSGFGGVKGSHDAGIRLHWELQPKKSVYQWKGPDEVDFVLKRVSDKAQAEKGRAEMKKVCNQCHTSRWTDGYLVEFDKVVSDYNMLWAYTDNLLKEVYAEGLASKDNPIDETPEIQHYLIWHHDGRRWRMGASMMGPDWTHWNGGVDTIMNKLGTMINDIETRRKVKKAEGM
jgi:organic hydroperoxide reductase OsmC/OhrA